MLRVLFLTLLSAFAGVARAAPLKVVATVPDLAALAAAVGGDRVEVTSMSLPTQDPHFVDARPNLALALSRADLLVVVGLELEVGWLPTLQTGARNGDIQLGGSGYLDCSSFVPLLQVPAGAVDRSMGDVHPGGNPHYLYDPRAAIPVAQGIAERMALLDPSNAEAYLAAADAFAQDMAARITDWARRLEPLRGAPVIQYHRSWPYLADWLGLRVVSDVEPKPGVPPTPVQVARVLKLAREQGVSLILQESYFPQTTAALVAEKAGARLVVLDGGADFAGGQGVDERFEALVARLEAAP